MRGGVGGGRGEQEEDKEGELCLACKMNFSKKMQNKRKQKKLRVQKRNKTFSKLYSLCTKCWRCY